MTASTTNPSVRAVVFSSQTDNWPTPQDTFDELDAEFGFTVDPAASAKNHKAPLWYGLDHPDPARRDGLAGDWAADAKRSSGACFVNPPYGKTIGAWMAKAAETSKAGVTVVCLVPARTDTVWFHDHVLAHDAEVRFVRGRLKFGDAKNTAPFASLVVVYRPANAASHLHSYTPRSLDHLAWQAARPVVIAAVAAHDCPSRSRASQVTGGLCRFLAWQPAWDKRSRPDLAALLTNDAINTFVATHSKAAQRQRDRTMLRRAAVVTGQAPTPKPRRTGSNAQLANAAAFWPNVTGLGPFTALAHAYKQLGNTCHRMTFHDLNFDQGPDLAVLLPPTGPNAVTHSADTVAAAGHAAQQLAAITAPSQASGGKTMPEPTEAQPSTSRRRTSRAANVRAGRAALATRQATPDRPALPAIPESINKAINNYRPQATTNEAWEQIREVTHLMMRAYSPATQRALSAAGWPMVRYAKWVAASTERTNPSLPLTLADITRDGLLDQFIESEKALHPDSTRATERAAVARALRHLTQTRTGEKIPHTAVKPPYTPKEVASLLAIARDQPTDAKRRQLSAALALGLGAGLDSRDQRAVTAGDIFEVTLATGQVVLVVAVRGSRPRTVIVSDAYVPVLRSAIAAAQREGRANDLPLFGRKEDRQSIIGPVRRGTSTATGEQIELSAARMRSTWLVAAMTSNVPLSVLLRAAGLRSARTLSELLPHCPQPPADAVNAALAAVQGTRGRQHERSATMQDPS